MMTLQYTLLTILLQYVCVGNAEYILSFHLRLYYLLDLPIMSVCRLKHTRNIIKLEISDRISSVYYRAEIWLSWRE